jgi:hypothetical protein
MLLSVVPSSPGAATLQESLDLQQATNSAAQASQQRIDAAAAETTKMLAEYREVGRRSELLRAYNAQMERLLSSQSGELDSLATQQRELQVTQRELLPLLVRMVETLARFVDLDLPFRLPERRHRVAELRALLDRADTGVAQKLRQVLDAYRVENDYGRSLESYRDTLSVDGTERTVEILRLGRVGLYFLTLDGAEAGYWDRAAGRWQVLPGDYRDGIRQGIRVASKEVAPDLVVLPVPAPEVAQ